MKSILVMCPTRDRPHSVECMIKSVFETSTDADVCLYIDEDQTEDYLGFTGEAKVIHGPVVGPVKSFNTMVEANPGYMVYVAATDDCHFVTPGWDKWVRDTAMNFPNTMGMIGPCNISREGRMDFPVATANWIKALGFFAYPGCYHYYWDVVLEDLAKTVGLIRYATDDDFQMVHDNQKSHLTDNKVYEDAQQAICWVAFHKDNHVERVRRALNGEVDDGWVGTGTQEANS